MIVNLHVFTLKIVIGKGHIARVPYDIDDLRVAMIEVFVCLNDAGPRILLSARFDCEDVSGISFSMLVKLTSLSACTNLAIRKRVQVFPERG